MPLRLAAWRWCSLAAAFLVLALPSYGQTRIITGVGPFTSCIGGSLAPAGDLTGDRVPDLLAGQGILGKERVVIFSGADGSIAHVIMTPTFGIQFSWSIDGGVDVTSDGMLDILVGSNLGSSGLPWPQSQENGSVMLYSGATKALVREHVGLPGQNVGGTVAFLGDLDGDGVPEYGAGATHNLGFGGGGGDVGEAYVYSGATGQERYHLTDGVPGADYGWAIRSIGDVDLDGVSEFCVTARYESSGGLSFNGAVYLYSGANGTFMRKDVGSNNSAYFGLAVAAIGDVDADGRADYVATAWNATNGAAVISGWTGSVISYIQSPLFPGVNYTPSPTVETIEDLDGNGLPEVVLRCFNGSGPRHVMISNCLTGEPLYYILDSQPQTGGFPGALAVLDDVDGDGREDLAISDSSATVSGEAYVYTTRALVAMEDYLPLAGGAIPLELNGGVPHAGAPYFVLASLSPAGSGSCSGLPIGTTMIPLCLDLLMSFSITLANIPPFVNTAASLDVATGKALASFDLTGVALPPSAVGVALWFAYIAKGGQPQEAGGPWTIASNPEAVVIQ